MRLFGTNDPAYLSGPATSGFAPASSGGCTLWPSPSYEGSSASATATAGGTDLIGIFPGSPAYLPPPVKTPIEPSRLVGGGSARKA